jgi:hypothetical protein
VRVWGYEGEGHCTDQHGFLSGAAFGPSCSVLLGQQAPPAAEERLCGGAGPCMAQAGMGNDQRCAAAAAAKVLSHNTLAAAPRTDGFNLLSALSQGGPT